MDLGLAVGYLKHETYNFDISPHKTPQTKLDNQKCVQTEICSVRTAYKNFQVSDPVQHKLQRCELQMG